jgi:hypothetical protein
MGFRTKVIGVIVNIINGKNKFMNNFGASNSTNIYSKIIIFNFVKVQEYVS